MATMDYSLSFKDSQDNNVIDDTSNGRFKSFNLNQNSSSDAFSELSKQVTTEKRKTLDYDVYHFSTSNSRVKRTAMTKKLLDFANNNIAKKCSNSWNKLSKNFSTSTTNNNNNYGKESDLKKGSNTKNSTLSLHISAYENSVEVSSEFFNKKEYLKQIFADPSTVIQNPFEFPRQQESDEAKMPEIAQYKATQKLFSPNDILSSEQNESEALGTVIEEKKEASKDIQTFNGVPHLLKGSTFANSFLIEERIGWNDTVGATYFALPLKSQKELILRVDSSERSTSGLFVEAALLKLAESQGRHLFFTQFYSYDLTAKFPWLAMYYRGGPTLNDCLNFLESKKFSHGTAGRFAHDIVSILEFIHQNGFLITKLDLNVLSLDPCSRNVFLSDMSEVKVNPQKRQLRIKPVVAWKGFADYAPLSHHGHSELCQWDELEAFFYVFYEMVVGELPWSGKHLTIIENLKLFFGQEDNFKALPSQYLDLWNTVMESKKSETNDYSKMKELCKEIYENVGGILDVDQNYDFEVDFPDLPEEELPRFVLEKTPVEGITQEDGSEVEDGTQEDDESEKEETSTELKNNPNDAFFDENVIEA